MDAQRQFREAMSRAGLPVPDEIIADGKYHRFSTNGKRSDKGGWYVMNADAIPNGAFGDWRGESQSWHADVGRNLTLAERGRLRQRNDEAKRQREQVEQEEYEMLADRAAAEWEKAKERLATVDYAYLKRKGVQPHGLRIDTNNRLMVPLHDAEFKIWSLQFIDADGVKRSLPGGRTAGLYCIIGVPDGVSVVATITATVCISEGFATAASIHESTGHPVAISFGSKNLETVARALRKELPHTRLVVCADDDIDKSGNPGETAATLAARAVGGMIAMPDFGADRPVGATDFNDLMQHRGLDAVKVCIDSATLVEPRNTLEVCEPVDASAELEGWEPPGEIIADLKPVPAFDAETLLPSALRTWITDEAERMPCPVEFVAVAAVVALGSVIGARCAIKPKTRDSWLIVPNLWGAIVGEPSAKKSPAWSVALKPMERLIKDALEEHSAELADYETKKLVHEAEKDAIEGTIKNSAKRRKSDVTCASARELRAHSEQAPVAPVMRRYKTNDSTVERLGELLRDNPTGLLVLRDELVGLIATWEKEGREGDRAFFLESWNGTDSFDSDRIGRGHISAPNLCLSIFGGIQPDKLVAYLEQASHALANDGMLQRFQMLVYPDARQWQWRDWAPNTAARDSVYFIFEKLANFDPVEWGANPADESSKFPWFRFDDAAQAVFIEWTEDLHLKRIPNEEEPIIQQHLAKFDKLFPALALTFHLVDCAADGVRGPVSKSAALRAAAFCELLEAHARRCYGLLLDGGLRAAQALASKLKRRKLKDGFTLRDVRRNDWRNLKTAESIQVALDWLEDEHWLRGEESGGTGPGTGRPTVRYRINPAIKASESGNDA